MARKPSAKRPPVARVSALLGSEVWRMDALAAALGVTESALERVLLTDEMGDVFCRDGVVTRCRWYSPDDDKPPFAVIEGGRSSAPPAATALAQHHNHGRRA